MIELRVNGQAHTLPQPSSLADLVAALGQAPERVATAVNGEFVARGQRGQRLLGHGDVVTCFQAIVGG